MTPRRILIDAFVGSRRDLLRLLRELHDGETLVAGLTRLQAIDAVCERVVGTRS